MLKGSSSGRRNLIHDRHKEIKSMGKGKMWVTTTYIFLDFNLFKRQLSEVKIPVRHMFHRIC